LCLVGTVETDNKKDNMSEKNKVLETANRNRIAETTNKNDSVLFIESVSDQLPQAEEIRASTPSAKTPVDDFSSRLEEIKPVFSECVGILDGAGVKLVEISASDICTATQLAKVGNMARMEDNSKTCIVNGASRIAARRMENLEVLDYAAIISGSVSWLAGITVAVSEIRKIAKEAKAKNGNSKQTDSVSNAK
jgi:hypothetical protein